mgnify:FL=1
MFSQPQGWFGLREPSRAFSAIVRKDGSTVWAEDASGKTIASGESGVDDASVINQAIQSGQFVFLAEGEYIIKEPIKLQHFTRLWGAGIGKTILKLADGANCNVIEGGDVVEHKYNVMQVDIGYFTIDGNKDNNTSGNGIHIICWDSVIHHLDIYKTPENGVFRDGGGASVDDTTLFRIRVRAASSHGIQIGSSYSAPKTFVINCISSGSGGWNFYARGNGEWFIMCLSYSGNGIYLDRCSNSRIIACSIEDFGASIAGNVGIFVRAAQGVDADSIIIANNYIRPADAEKGAIRLVGETNYLRNVLIQGNTIDVMGGYTAPYILTEYGNIENAVFKNNAIYGDFTNFSDGVNVIVKNNIGYTTENSGTATFSGDGTTTQFSIAHGLVSTPSKVLVTPMTADAASDFYVTADDTNIYINYKSAPPSGTDNLKFSWYAEV